MGDDQHRTVLGDRRVEAGQRPGEKLRVGLAAGRRLAAQPFRRIGAGDLALPGAEMASSNKVRKIDIPSPGAVVRWFGRGTGADSATAPAGSCADVRGVREVETP